MRSKSIPRLAALLFALFLPIQALAACPDLLNHSMKKLHSSDQVNLCESFSGKPLVIVNTASHCGFTYQFENLENLFQQYGPKGVNVVGVASDSFYQAAASEEKAAEVCFVNFGVSFTMLAPVPVKGEEAHLLFQQLAGQSAPPQWNFTKYVIDRTGQVAASFGSNITPDDPAITGLLDKMIAN